MSEPYLRSLRRLLLLVPVAVRAARQGRGVPLGRAVALTGARGVPELLADLESIRSLWVDPERAEDLVSLDVEDGEVHLLYAHELGRPVALSLAEGAVLLAALAPFEETAGKPVREAVRKLRKAIPEPLRPEAEQLVRGLDVVLAPTGPWAAALREAIAARLEVALEYRAVGDGVLARRTVEPRALFHRDGQWYLAAWNVEKAHEHLYRLDRIASVTTGTRVFGPHQASLARYAGKLYFESGAEREVTLRLGGVAARVARSNPALRLRENGDGSVSVVQRVTPGNYLAGAVLGWGGEATVEGPADVREGLRARVAELAARYADG
ncbi:WYL domain-containing protein [Anaeromyxobacter sp. PSR-1]|uniref:WYL domain-containing protein n=1 Tax=Anaeromyxobacter sp. PSR-1 TaxID=1300915 RepID=UPI0005E8DBE2|nr:WYL domain-containing protein [Anaeromyxobacter sp. PSR-1]GAO04763.1 hypothetical protein PSR1_03659 [Anaeromyxobacter sp. PSR-1]